MCHYISAILPATADEEAVRIIADRFHRSLDPQLERLAKKHLQSGEQLYCTTRAHCDCGTALGSMATRKTSSAGRFEKALRKRRKKGWSESKIEAWLDQARRTAAKEERSREGRGMDARPDALSWLEFLLEVLASGATDRIGLLLYWVDPNWAEITSQPRVRVPAQELDADVLLRMEEDRIYDFS